jgi:hypothetical protein
MFLGITPVSSVSNGLYFLNLPLVSVMCVIYTSKGMSKKFGVHVILLGARYLSKNTSIYKYDNFYILMVIVTKLGSLECNNK